MQEQPGYSLTCELEFNNEHLVAWMYPYYEMTAADIRAYKIIHYCYLVHVFSTREGFKTFEMFPEGNYGWGTNASELLIDRKIVRVLSVVLQQFIS